jgi:hypothetical protein
MNNMNCHIMSNLYLFLFRVYNRNFKFQAVVLCVAELKKENCGKKGMRIFV